MRYVSIDIETTGLDRQNDQVLEIGAVIEDTDKQLDFNEIPRYKAIINHDRLSGNVYAFNLNARILEILANIPKFAIGNDANEFGIKKTTYIREHNIIKPEDFALSFQTFLTSNGYKENESNGEVKVIVAGKNFASFDQPFIERLLNLYRIPLINFGHRYIDPVNFFIDFETDKDIPSLNKCLEIAGIDDEVTHNALLDAWDVVRVMRKIY
jgi:oligoribonuclease